MAVELTGRLICADAAEAALVRAHLPEHLRLTRAEPGCERFEVAAAGPLTWQVDERFTARADFEAHQARTRVSAWGRATAGIRRDFRVFEA